MASVRASFCLIALALASGLPCGLAHADCPSPETYLMAGVEDEFAPPPEPTSPSPEVLAYVTQYWPSPPIRQFDTIGTDLVLIHTFTGWTGPVCGARLKLRLAAGSSSLVANDGVWLSFVGGPDIFDSFVYRTTIANIAGSWAPGSVETMDVDLSALPIFEDYPTNILDALSDGALEVLVEDDSAVDYAFLAICPCPVPVERSSWGAIKGLYGPRY